jgi:hypothetical protein
VEWHSIHIYYYERNKDALILEGVRLLLRRLAGRFEAASFTRHWRFGPHLRLNIRTDADTFATVVSPAVHEIIGGFLTRCPSTRTLDPERELPTHQLLARVENEEGALLPWHPDNSIRMAGYDRRVEALGNAEMADLLTDFHASTNDFAFRAIDEVRGPGRLALSFDLMIATAHALSGRELTQTFVSFRSHAEAFLSGLPEGDGRRAAWDGRYTKSGTALVDRVGAVTAAVDVGQPPMPFVRDWVAMLSPLRERAIQLATDGRLVLDSWASVADRAAETTLGEISPFHRTLLANPDWPRTRDSDQFRVYRVMLNLTYLLMTTIGVTSAERYLLCHLAANAVEDRYDISAHDLVDGSRSPRMSAR